MRFTIVCFLIVSFHLVFAGQAEGQKKLKGFEVPSKYVSLLLVSDPNCPIQLSGPPKVIRYENKTFSYNYTMQNVSNTAVTSIIVERISWFGNQGSRDSYNSTEGDWLFPNMNLSSLDDDDDFELINFDEIQEKQFEFSEIVRNVWVVMVIKVIHNDGTVYDVSSKYKTIKKFTEDLELNSKMSLEQVNAQEEKLRAYIENVMKSAS